MGRFFFVSLLTACTNILFAQSTSLNVEGIYRGGKMYLSNPNGTCISEIFVNNRPVSFNKATAFEVDLSFLAKESAISIRVIHASNCTPVIINLGQFLKKIEFSFVELKVSDKQLIWKAKGEQKGGTYTVEKFEHNAWQIEQVIHVGQEAYENTHKTEPKHHTGENKYRIRYDGSSGIIYYSEEVVHKFDAQKVEVYPMRFTDKLMFSREVKYSISDQYGKVKLQGFGKEVDCSSLEGSSPYYVSFDNRTEKVFKK